MKLLAPGAGKTKRAHVWVYARGAFDALPGVLYDAGCLDHARRKFDELIRDNQSPVALQVVPGIAWIYRTEPEVQSLTIDERLAVRQS